MDCELCGAYEEKYRLVDESEYSFSVVCKAPLNAGHVLVISKRCVSEITYLEPHEMIGFWMQAQKVRVTLESMFDESVLGLRHHGVHQTQEHFHYHLLPSKKGLRDMYVENQKKKRVERTEEQMQHIRDLIIKSLQK